jgi:sugar transferase (PEP-CTERM/EpsH1 system associated)
MTGRREVLFLAHRIPYPPDKGDKIRSWRLLQLLAERFDVHLACFVDDPKDGEHIPFLRNRCKSATFVSLSPWTARLRSATALVHGRALSLSYYMDSAMKRAVSAVRRRPLAVEIAFSSTMAQYIEDPVAGRPRIIDFCDADSDKFALYANDAAFPMNVVYRREGKLLAKAETDIANWADAAFAITPEEAGLFNGRPNIEQSVDWWSNGVDLKYFDPQADFVTLPRTADVVFIGAMDYRANIDAVLYFAREIWPLVRNAAPEATFAIVGSRPSSAVKALDGRNGVIVTGRVEDTRPWLAQAALAVAPIRIARGVQNKVLEAMAMARPVVASEGAATGIAAARNEHIIVADKPQAFADAVTTLLKDASLGERIGTAARACITERYQWDRQLSRFSDALDACVSAPPAG